MKDALIVSLLSVTPRKRGARTMGWLARRRASRWLNRAFVRAYQVDLSEATGALEDYRTLEALFTRSLKPGARPVATEARAVVSPVDGVAAWVGTSTDGAVPVTPRHKLRLSELVDEPVTGERDVAILYLSPRDYHRVHVPREARATAWRYVPGTLWPVFPAAVRRVRDLFARNERVSVHLDSDIGPLTVVLVGAFGVGRITLEVCDLITNSGGRHAAGALTPPVPLERGALLGTFHLGSTVVLLAPTGQLQWTVEPGERVRCGAVLARSPAQLTGS